MNAPQKLLKGFLYTLGSGYLARLASVVLTVLIKRELPPSVFTDAVFAVTLFTLLASPREFGLMYGLLHFQEKTRAFIETHFTLNLIVCGLTLVLALGALGALHFGWPQRFPGTPLLLAGLLSILFFLRNLTLTAEGLLRLDLEFGRLSLFHGLGTVLALLGTLAAAWAGWGVWSLILGGWANYSVFSAIYLLCFALAVGLSRPQGFGRLRLDPAWTRRLLGYGVWIWIGWMLQTFVLWYDKLVVRLVVGRAEMALYENAWWLVQIPTAILTHIIFNYTNTVYARYQHDRPRLSEVFSRMLSLEVWIAWPLALVLVLNAGEVMALMPDWDVSATMIVWLAGYAFLRPLMDDCFGLLWAVGGTRLSARLMGVQALVAAVLVPAMAWQWGVKGVALSMGAVAALGLGSLFWGVRRYASVSWPRIFGAPLLGLGLAASAGLGYNSFAQDQALVDFALRSGLIVGIYAGVVGLLERRQLAESVAQVRRLLAERRA
jgi:O-antigen/teichoic acid export membrane protein